MDRAEPERIMALIDNYADLRVREALEEAVEAVRAVWMSFTLTDDEYDGAQVCLEAVQALFAKHGGKG